MENWLDCRTKKDKNKLVEIFRHGSMYIHLKNSIYRVFFCGRNNKNISLIGSFDVDLKKKKVFNFSKTNLLQVNLELLMIMVLQHHVLLKKKINYFYIILVGSQDLQQDILL